MKHSKKRAKSQMNKSKELANCQSVSDCHNEVQNSPLVPSEQLNTNTQIFNNLTSLKKKYNIYLAIAIIWMLGTVIIPIVYTSIMGYKSNEALVLLGFMIGIIVSCVIWIPAWSVYKRFNVAYHEQYVLPVCRKRFQSNERSGLFMFSTGLYSHMLRVMMPELTQWRKIRTSERIAGVYNHIHFASANITLYHEGNKTTYTDFTGSLFIFSVTNVLSSPSFVIKANPYESNHSNDYQHQEGEFASHDEDSCPYFADTSIEVSSDNLGRLFSKLTNQPADFIDASLPQGDLLYFDGQISDGLLNAIDTVYQNIGEGVMAYAEKLFFIIMPNTYIFNRHKDDEKLSYDEIDKRVIQEAEWIEWVLNTFAQNGIY